MRQSLADTKQCGGGGGGGGATAEASDCKCSAGSFLISRLWNVNRRRCFAPNINSDKINSLWDRRRIKWRFDGSRLKFWPLKCPQYQSLSSYLSFQMKVSSRSRVTPERKIVRTGSPKAFGDADRWAQMLDINLCLRRYHRFLTAFVFLFFFPSKWACCGFVLYILEMFA